MRTPATLALLALLACHAAASASVAVRSRAGRACMFEGGSNQIAAGAPVRSGKSAMTAFTVAYWFRTDAITTNLYPILSYGNYTSGLRHFALGAPSTASWIYMFNDDGSSFYASNGPELSTQWNHIAGTWRSSDGDARIYLNGALLSSSTMFANSSIPTGGYFFFPEMLWSAKLFGVADDLAAWAARLDASEIAAVYAGNTSSVRPDDAIMHWTCDESSSDSIADSANTAPATIISGSAVSKVPSSAPGPNSGFAVLAVPSTGATVINFPRTVSIVTLPSSGTLSATIGASVKSVTYTPSSTLTKDSFNVTYYGQVVLQANTAPSPTALTASIAETSTWDVAAAYWALTTSFRRGDLSAADAEAYPLSATVTRLPSCGSLAQTDGTAITKVGTNVTNENLLVSFTATEGSYGCVTLIGFSVCDEVACTQVVHNFTIGLPNQPPIPVPTNATVLQDSTGVLITLNLRLDPTNSSTIVLTQTPAHGKLYTLDGSLIDMKPTPRLVYQWVSDVIGFSNQYDTGDDDSYHASQVIGAPDVYPAAGDSSLAWANDGSGNRYEWIIVSYDQAVNVEAVVVYEVYCPGAIYRVSLYDEEEGVWVAVYEGTPRTVLPDEGCDWSQAFKPTLYTGFFPILASRVRLDIHRADEDWPEIDAIRLIGHLAVDAAHISGRTVRYVPNEDFYGADSFEFTADVNGELEEAAFERSAYYTSPSLGSVNITIQHVNTRPVANSTSLILAFGETTEEVSVALTASDDDGDNLTYTLVSAPQLGKLYTLPIGKSRSVLVDGSKFSASSLYYYYICKEPSVHEDSLQFSATDGSNATSTTATIKLQVFCAHDKGYDKKAVKGLVAALVVTDVLFAAALVGVSIALARKNNAYGGSSRSTGAARTSEPVNAGAADGAAIIMQPRNQQ